MNNTVTNNNCPACGEYEEASLVFHGQCGDQIECQTCGHDYEATVLPWAAANKDVGELPWAFDDEDESEASVLVAFLKNRPDL